MAISAEKLNIILAARDKEFTKAMERSQRRVEMFAKKSQRELNKTSKSFGGLGAAATKLGGVLSAGALAAGMTRIIDNATRAAIEIDNLSRISGTSVERFQEMAYAANQFGIGQEKLSDILKDVNDKFGDYFSTGAGPLADFFDNIAPKVGLTADAFRGLSSDQALGLYVKSLQDAGVSQSQLTFYMEALASDATALAPLMANNAAKLNELAAAGRDLGVVIDEDLIKKSVNLRRRWDEIIDKMRSKFSVFAMEVAVGLAGLFEFGEAGKATSLERDMAATEAALADKMAERAKLYQRMDEAFGGESDVEKLDVQRRRIVDRALSQIDTLNGEIMMAEAYLSHLGTNAPTPLGEIELPVTPEGGTGIASSSTVDSLSKMAAELDSLLNVLEPATKAARDFAKQEEKINEIVAAGLISRERGNELIAAAADQMNDAQFAASKLATVAETMQSSMESAFMGIVDGTMTAKDAFRSMAAEVIKELYRVLVVQQLVGSFKTGGGGILGSLAPMFGRASGGAVQAGQPYMTGEHGRELFVPSQNGRILSAAQTNNMQRGGGDGGVTVIQNNTFGNGVNRAEINAMLPKIVEASKAAVMDAKRQGGSYGKAFG